MKFKEKIKKIPGPWLFLVLIMLVYFLFSLFNKEIYLDSLNLFGEIILKIIPIFILVFVLMSIFNYFITPGIVKRHLKERGVKKWFFVILGGILSSGPIYMWYPLLADLRNKGLNYGLIACFLYNRAIKLPLIPLAIVYFSWQYILILLIVMIFASVIQGILLNKLIDFKR